jgi:hypothetical protein
MAFYFNIDSNFALKVIPETKVIMDGHPILTQSYDLYRDVKADDAGPIFWGDDDRQKQLNPNYLGAIVFEVPGRVFNYVADGQQSLSRDQIEQAVEQISHYRDNPDLWPHADLN